MNRAHVLSLAVLSLGCLTAGHAELITSMPGGTAITMPTVNYTGEGPEAFSGITWSANVSDAVFGSTNAGFGFGSNGQWLAGFSSVAQAGDGTMTFAFSSPVSSIGGFFNYFAGLGIAPLIAVYNTSDQLIESYTLSFSTGGGNNSGFFYGFQESSADIGYFTVNGITAVTNLEETGTQSAVPEPGSLILFATVAGAIGLFLKRTC